MTPHNPATGVREHLSGLTREVVGVRGALIASRDGHPLADNLPTQPGDSSVTTAAMIAALLGIGQRLSELTGDSMLMEATVRSPAGQVVIYAVGTTAVMTVLTDASVNLARLHHAARLRLPSLAALVDDEAPAPPAVVA